MRSWRYDENGHIKLRAETERRIKIDYSSPFTRECNHSNLEAQIPTIRICSCFVVSCCRGVAPKSANHSPPIMAGLAQGSLYNLKLTLDFYSLSAGELIQKLFCVMLWYALLRVATKPFDSADIISINNPSADGTLDSWVVPTTSSVLHICLIQLFFHSSHHRG